MVTPQRLRVLGCPAGPDAAELVLPALAAALDGRGAALALVPDGDAAADRTRAAMRPGAPLEVPGVAALVSTSGSTGTPKAVLLTAAALRASAAATLDRLGGPGRWLLALPAEYVAGLQVLVRSLLAGSAPVALDRREPFTAAGFAAATGRLGGDRRYTALVPAQLHRVLDDRAGTAALGSYDAVLLGGAAADPALLARARDTGAVVVPTYGMSETCGGCVYDGVPLDGVVTEVGSDGRVLLGGPVLAAGYRLRPEATAAAFPTGADGERRHRTPDLGRYAADGRLEILGRADDVAVSGGVNVPLGVVERTVAGVPGVAAAACVGAPDPEWGERVVAFVVTEAGAQAPSRALVRDVLVAAGLPRTWSPREIVAVPALPALASGKVDRRALRTAAGGG